VQSVLGLGNLALAYLLGRRLLGHAAGLAGALLLCLYAPVLFLETKVLTETVAIFLALATLLAAEAALRRPSAPRFLSAGLLAGLATVARPNVLVALMLAAAWVAFRALRRRPVARPALLAVAAAGALLVLLPVTARNLVVGGDLVLVSSNGGIVFAQGNHPDATGVSTVLPGFTPRIEDQQEQELAVASRALGHPATPSESSSWWFRRGLDFAASQPALFADLWLRKAAWALHAREARDVYNLYQERELAPVLGYLALPFPVLLGLALFGLGARRRDLPDGARLALLYAASIFATLVAFSVSFRYRAPVAPVLALFAGAGLVAAVQAARDLRWRPLAAAAACVVLPSLVSLVPYPLPAITAEAPANLGAAELSRGHPDAAIAWSLRALSLNPDLAPAHYNLGLALRKKGDLPHAADELAAAVRLAPDDPAARSDLAVTLDESGRTAEAIDAYREALARRFDPRTSYNLALALFAARRYGESREALDAARAGGVAPDPRFVDTLNARLAAPPAPKP
jgi:tetratricopeptide (TPR) repeat protein